MSAALTAIDENVAPHAQLQPDSHDDRGSAPQVEVADSRTPARHPPTAHQVEVVALEADALEQQEQEQQVSENDLRQLQLQQSAEHSPQLQLPSEQQQQQQQSFAQRESDLRARAAQLIHMAQHLEAEKKHVEAAARAVIAADRSVATREAATLAAAASVVQASQHGAPTVVSGIGVAADSSGSDVSGIINRSSGTSPAAEQWGTSISPAGKVPGAFQHVDVAELWNRVSNASSTSAQGGKIQQAFQHVDVHRRDRGAAVALLSSPPKFPAAHGPYGVQAPNPSQWRPGHNFNLLHRNVPSTMTTPAAPTSTSAKRRGGGTPASTSRRGGGGTTTVSIDLLTGFPSTFQHRQQQPSGTSPSGRSLLEAITSSAGGQLQLRQQPSAAPVSRVISVSNTSNKSPAGAATRNFSMEGGHHAAAVHSVNLSGGSSGSSGSSHHHHRDLQTPMSAVPVITITQVDLSQLDDGDSDQE